MSIAEKLVLIHKIKEDLRLAFQLDSNVAFKNYLDTTYPEFAQEVAF